MRNRDKNVSVVLLAAGRGKRAGGVQKQFLPIHGTPILFYSITCFLKCPAIDRIVVVVPGKSHAWARQLMRAHFPKGKIAVVHGGPTRRASTFAGLRHLKNGASRYVIVHDAVRPMISTRGVNALISAARKHGAALMGVPAIDTVGKGKDGILSSIPDRSELYSTFTPHCYEFELLWEAHRARHNAGRTLKDAENSVLFTRMGHTIRVVGGFYPNLKLTYPEDIRLIEAMLK